MVLVILISSVTHTHEQTIQKEKHETNFSFAIVVDDDDDIVVIILEIISFTLDVLFYLSQAIIIES